jgi:carboxypeptidase D
MPVPLEEIQYVDYPELLINEHERTEMPFRYVKDTNGEPIMPDVSDLLNYQREANS